jgi:hypothetical protein
MKKIRLNVDCIEVASFPTADIPEDKGTVEAHFRSIPGDTFCGEECQTQYYCGSRYCGTEGC